MQCTRITSARRTATALLLGAVACRGEPAADSAAPPGQVDESHEAALASGLSLEGVPDIYFAQTSHDFGVVAQDAAVEHVFVFANRGDAPLIMSNPKGS